MAVQFTRSRVPYTVSRILPTPSLALRAGLLALLLTLPLLRSDAQQDAAPLARPEPQTYNLQNFRTYLGNAPNNFPLLSIACSPDGSTLAVSGEDKSIKLLAANDGKEKLVLKGHDDMVVQVAFSPDGKLLASAGFDGDVRLWEVASGKPLRVLKGHTNWVFAVAFSPDGNTLASGGYDRSLRLWDVATGKELANLTKHRGGVRCVAFSKDGTLLASAGSDTTLRIWDVAKREVIHTIRAHEDAVRCVAFSPVSKRVVTGSEDGTLRLWNTDDGKQVASQTLNVGVRAVAFSPRGSSLAVVCENSNWRIHDPTTLANRNNAFTGGNIPVTGVAYSPDAGVLYTTGLDQSVRVRDGVYPSRLPVVTLPYAGQAMWVSQFSPDGKWLLAAGTSRSLEMRNAQFGRETAAVKGLTKAVFSVAVSPDGDTFATGDLDEKVKLYDVKTQKLKATLSGHKYRVWSVVFSPVSKRLVTAAGSWENPSEVGEIKVWDLTTNKLLRDLPDVSASVQSIAWSPDGKTIAAGSRDGVGRLYDAETGKVRAVLSGHTVDVRSLSFSPKGRWLASSSSDGTVRIWDVTTGGQKLALSATATGANSVAWSPDGHWLAASSKPAGSTAPGEVRRWRVEFDEYGNPGFTALPVMKGHYRDVLTVAFSSDSKRLVSGGGTYTGFGELLLWDVETGRHLATLHGHQRWVESAVFTKDGKSLISAGGTQDLGELRLWNTDASGWKIADAHNAGINAAAWSRDGTTVATSSFDKSIKLWDAASGKVKATLKGHAEHARTLAFSPDGRTLVSGGLDKTVRLWDLGKNVEIKELARYQKVVTSVAFSPDGKLLATTSADPLWRDQTGEIRVFEMDTGRERNGDWRNRPAMSVAFSPDGKTVVTGGSGAKGLFVYNALTGSELRSVAGATSVRCVAFSKDGRYLATAHGPGGVRGEGSLQVWDTRSWNEVSTLASHTKMCFGLGFAPDGKTLASASDDQTVRLWDLSELAPRTMFGLRLP